MYGAVRICGRTPNIESVLDYGILISVRVIVLLPDEGVIARKMIAKRLTALETPVIDVTIKAVFEKTPAKVEMA